MADAILLLWCKLGHRAATVRQPEDRIVAKSSPAAGLVRDHALADAFDGADQLAWLGQRDDAAEAGSALLPGHVAQALEHQMDAVGIARVGARKAPRVHAR